MNKKSSLHFCLEINSTSLFLHDSGWDAVEVLWFGFRWLFHGVEVTKIIFFLGSSSWEWQVLTTAVFYSESTYADVKMSHALSRWDFMRFSLFLDSAVRGCIRLSVCGLWGKRTMPRSAYTEKRAIFSIDADTAAVSTHFLSLCISFLILPISYSRGDDVIAIETLVRWYQ